MMDTSDIRALTKAIGGLDESIRSMQGASAKKTPRKVEVKAMPDAESTTSVKVS